MNTSSINWLAQVWPSALRNPEVSWAVIAEVDGVEVKLDQLKFAVAGSLCRGLK